MNILMVCLGNICRSPLAEGIMKEKVRIHKLKVLIDSAGTAAYHVGERPDIRSMEVALKHGIDISEQRARKFTVEDFDLFDKIYAMDETNYSDLVAQARTEEEKNKVEMILNTIYPDQNLQVPDPYFGGDDGFDNVYNMLDQACEQIAVNLIEEK